MVQLFPKTLETTKELGKKVIYSEFQDEYDGVLFVRTDANSEIGIGHVMRCLSIADEFSKALIKVVFVLADRQALSIVGDRGYEAVVLDSDYKFMEEETALWSVRGINLLSSMILVDSYYVTEKYLNQLKGMLGSEGKLIYIGGFSFPYPVDVLINYNIYARKEEYDLLYRNISDTPTLLLGTAYAPLRAMFVNVPKKKQSKVVDKVLISVGGADSLHICEKLVEYICNYLDKDDLREYHFLLGVMNSDIRKIETISENEDNIIIHKNVMDMKSLITNMDLIVSAAGSTLYEICSCGIPLITFSFADNQILGAMEFDKQGLAINIGDIRYSEPTRRGEKSLGRLKNGFENKIFSSINMLSADYNRRKEMGEKMQKLVDGKGAERLVKHILKEI